MKFKWDTEKFIEESKKNHRNKYDYSKFIYVNNDTKGEIICPIHDSFFQTSNNHLRNKGCPKCSFEKLGNIRRKSNKKFINRANEIHNNEYDYLLKNYKNTHSKIEIFCKKHGSFIQRASAHLLGQKCPKCSVLISKPELEFLNYLSLPNTKECRQKNINNLRVDGYDPKTNTVYEFLGDYWHGNPEKYNLNDINKVCNKTFRELYNNTFKKLNDLRIKGYKVKYIWENDWKKLHKKRNILPLIVEL